MVTAKIAKNTLRRIFATLQIITANIPPLKGGYILFAVDLSPNPFSCCKNIICSKPL